MVILCTALCYNSFGVVINVQEVFFSGKEIVNHSQGLHGARAATLFEHALVFALDRAAFEMYVDAWGGKRR